MEVKTEDKRMNMGDEFDAIQKESIKLTKNSRGYNWEIKVFLEEDGLDKLDKINERMTKNYGN